MSNFVAMCIGGGIGSVVGAVVGFGAAALCRVAAKADRDLESCRRDDKEELANIVDKRV